MSDDGGKGSRDHEFRMAVLSTAQLLINKVQPTLMVFFVCAAATLSSRYLAGKTTAADIVFRVLADLKGLRPLADLLMGGVGAGGFIYGKQQENLRKRTEKRVAREKAALPPIQPSLFPDEKDS